MSKNHWAQALYKKKGETLEKNYLFNDIKLKNTNMMFDYVDSRISLNSNSKVLELGCNLARNLLWAYTKYRCYVTGYDINKESIEKNKDRFKEKGDFYIADLRDASILQKYKNDSFDLGITMGFLMHIPQSKNKEFLISELLRICKRVCIFEIFNPNRKDMLLENEWSLSFEDYRKYSKNIILTDVVSKYDENFVLFYYEKSV
jgi:ubiquinone/menaquinone biosynthesis C-methylase UbiE